MTTVTFIRGNSNAKGLDSINRMSLQGQDTTYMQRDGTHGGNNGLIAFGVDGVTYLARREDVEPILKERLSSNTGGSVFLSGAPAAVHAELRGDNDRVREDKRIAKVQEAYPAVDDLWYFPG